MLRCSYTQYHIVFMFEWNNNNISWFIYRIAFVSRMRVHGDKHWPLSFECIRAFALVCQLFEVIDSFVFVDVYVCRHLLPYFYLFFSFVSINFNAFFLY